MSDVVVTPTHEEVKTAVRRFGAVMNSAVIDMQVMFETIISAFGEAAIFRNALRHPGSKTYAQEVCSCCKGTLRRRTSPRSQCLATVPCRRCVARP